MRRVILVTLAMLLACESARSGDPEPSDATGGVPSRGGMSPGAAGSADAGPDVGPPDGPAGETAGTGGTATGGSGGSTGGSGGSTGGSGGSTGGSGGSTGGAGGSGPTSVCAPDALRCSGAVLQVCRAEGEAWSDLSNCGARGCNATRMACNQCQPNARSCTGSTLSSCRSDGSGTLDVQCPDGCRPDGTDCLTCPANQHACEGVCRPSDSPASCGTRCSACPDVPNAEEICSGGQCGFNCGSGLRCSGADACEATSYSFEMTQEGWNASIGDDSAEREYAISKTRAHAGGAALAGAINVSATRYAARIGRGVCGGVNSAVVDLRNKTLSFWVYIDSANAPPDGHRCYAGGFSGQNPFGWEVAPPTFSTGRWAQTRITFTGDAAARPNYIGIDCRFNTSTSWSGTIFFDDFRLE